MTHADTRIATLLSRIEYLSWLLARASSQQATRPETMQSRLDEIHALLGDLGRIQAQDAGFLRRCPYLAPGGFVQPTD